MKESVSSLTKIESVSSLTEIGKAPGGRREFLFTIINLLLTQIDKHIQVFIAITVTFAISFKLTLTKYRVLIFLLIQ